jgi:dihydrouridine synthase, putative
MILSLAPMADITHLGFRRLVASFSSPNLFYSEMIHSPSLLSGGHFEKWYTKTYDSEALIWQLTSNETESVKDVIPILLNEGGVGIDLNMGCAAPHIVATGAGFAWTKKPKDEVKKFIQNARNALDEYCKNTLPKTLSVKMRLPSDKYSEVLDFCSFLIDCGVEQITMHPRFQKEKYSRVPHYEYLEKLSQDLSIPIFGNGEIKSLEDIQKLQEKFPKVEGWMIGREAVKRPWIFLTMNGKKDVKIDTLHVVRMFIELLKENQPEEFHLLRAKRFFNYFCNNFTFAHYIKTKVLNTKSIDEIISIFEVYFEEMPDDRIIIL